jgi:hypothetical protein
MSGSRVGRRRVVVGAMALFAVCLGSGCDGCFPKTTGRKRTITDDTLVLWDHLRKAGTPNCKLDSDCEAQLGCSPEQTAVCGFGRMFDDRRYCKCTHLRLEGVPTVDGGTDYVWVKCVRNPAGGAPLCGRWDERTRLTRDADGGIIPDSHPEEN